MANLGRVTMAALTAQNENSMALANLNFDFSLVKLEAPLEFRGVGNSLSLWRRTAAESGTAHRTARKLGALFEQAATIPDSLYAAYGLRVSEISASEAISPQERHRYSVFEGHVGADATTIWAAATAGKSAMAINLLACMLARLWSDTQATSIWFELVECRKKQINSECDGSESTHIPQLLAAQQEITRKELAEWDSSSRAWVSLANRVKKKEHQELEPILQSLTIPVDTSVDLFTSVMRAWNIAMSTVDGLIRGMPHSVNGAVLVAISAWHIYPDIDMFDPHKKFITFRDPLVQPGGRLTIGLEDRMPENTSGVYWSLSLARLRYYGAPMALTARAPDESKVTFQDFSIVIFGSLLRLWAENGNDFKPNFEIREASQLFVTIWEMLEKAAPVSMKCREFMLLRNNWMRALVSAAQVLADSSNEGWHRAKRLALMGIRRGLRVLPAGQDFPPFFGFLNPSTLTSMLRDSDSATVGFLRDLAKRRNLEGQETVICYKSQATGLTEFATAVPNDRHSVKRTNDGKHSTSSGHTRWIRALETDRSAVCDCESDFETEVQQVERDSDGEPRYHEGTRTLKWEKVKQRSRRKARKHKKEITSCPISVQAQKTMQHTERKKSIESHGELCLEYDPVDIALKDQLVSWFNPPTYIDGGGPVASTTSGHVHDIDGSQVPASTEPDLEPSVPDVDLDWEQTILELDRWTDHRTRNYRCIVGRIEEAALLVREEDGNSDDPTPEYAQLSVSEAQDMAVTKALDADKVLNHLLQLLSNHGSEKKRKETQRSNCLKTFKILGSASQIYKLLPAGPVALRLLEHDLSRIGWARNLSCPDQQNVSSVFSSFKMNRAQALACVATFTTGTMDIEEMELQNVLAISVGNCIYAPSALLNDPYDLCEEFEIMMIVGNVGKPGLTMMIPPSDPRIVEPEHDRWQVVNHEPFDGSCQDYFDKTSFHLSFTGYEQPVASAVKHGAQDVEAQYLETLVSVYDGNRWIADLDILAALGNARFKRLELPSICTHGNCSARPPQWISVDCWDELIDTTEEANTFIVRAHGNPLARLSAVTLAVQIGNAECLVLPVDVKCYHCVSIVSSEANEAMIRGRHKKVLVC